MTTHASLVPVISQRWMGAWNAKDPDAMRALFTPDGIYEDLAFKISANGQKGVATWVQISIDHIPNLSGGTMARIGLRMMPPFPSSP
jgi:SnoaL-like domain